MVDPLLTPDHVAELLGLKDGAQVLRIAREQDWPRVALTNKNIRFTEADIAEIIRRSRKAHEKPRGLPGQTTRSRARSGL
ncbi:hypothetical protein ASD11_04565 [Aeromicrobium sp. Root495]|uniref:hypothetical protein n=1 Tax=Aeromicrobium sp. Root495 TaxID=1736550 RepID=UPI0006F5CF55|nr:hypothetical protein [Aeromicrobium sp. Root495]KQY58906.1 hypothetical protein ASD11_04565 [Aeromicrobium sp. Root495]